MHEDDTIDQALTTAQKATTLAETYGEAIIRISAVLGDDQITPTGKVNRVRLVIAGLDADSHPTTGQGESDA